MLWGLTLINGVRWSCEPVLCIFVCNVGFSCHNLVKEMLKVSSHWTLPITRIRKATNSVIKFETIHIVLDQIRPTSTCDLGAQRRAPFCEMQIGSLGCAWNSSYILGCSAVQEGGFTFHTSNLPALLVLIFRLVNSPSLWSTFIPPQFVLYFS